jgi:tRNA-dihydrouridine synthase B
MKWYENKKTILALAPMADMTDSPFCQMVKKIGGVDVVFREMVSSEAIVRDSQKTLSMVDFAEAERPIVQQIFGSNPLTMAKAAEIIIDRVKPDGIDINMGCPVHKITSNFNGCALMKDKENAANIVKEVRKAIGDTPLSVKIRLGWSSRDDFKEFIPIIEEAGAEVVTMHGRTRSDGYSGVADWERIKIAKQISTGVLLANGDISEPEKVTEALEVTGADGVMIGRGVLGNPWFFLLAKEHLTNTDISIEERKKIMVDHARLHIDYYGEKAITTFRKHLSWYTKANKIGVGIVGLKELRSKLVRVNSVEELEELLSDFN